MWYNAKVFGAKLVWNKILILLLVTGWVFEYQFLICKMGILTPTNTGMFVLFFM